MSVYRCSALLIGLLVVGVAGSAAPPTSKDDASWNWRQEQREFRKLPPATQERIRRLDRDLHAKDAQTQARLFKAMQRYSDWLDHLAPEDRRLIDDATSNQDKLQVIREIRDRQWVGTLSKADRDRYDAAKTREEKLAIINQLRNQEHERELQWQLTTRAEDSEEINRWIKNDMARWVEEQLLPKLSNMDKKRLTNRNNPRAMIELARKYDVPLPPALEKLEKVQQRLKPRPPGTPPKELDRD